MAAQCLRIEINTSTSYSGSVGSTFLWFLAGVLFFVSKQQTNRQFLTQRSMRTGELERDTRKKEEKGEKDIVCVSAEEEMMEDKEAARVRECGMRSTRDV